MSKIARIVRDVDLAQYGVRQPVSLPVLPF
jgi:hypothetical protein